MIEERGKRERERERERERDLLERLQYDIHETGIA